MREEVWWRRTKRAPVFWYIVHKLHSNVDNHVADLNSCQTSEVVYDSKTETATITSLTSLALRVSTV